MNRLGTGMLLVPLLMLLDELDQIMVDLAQQAAR